MTEFESKVYAAVRSIPPGHAATYGQVAKLAGYPGAARAVGNALHHNPDPIGTPCFRVVNAQGRLSPAFGFGGVFRQKEMLEADGIHVVNFTVDLEEYGFSETDARDE